LEGPGSREVAVTRPLLWCLGPDRTMVRIAVARPPAPIVNHPTIPLVPIDRSRKQGRRVPRHPTPFILLDAALSEPLHRQLYDAIRAAIVSGRLPAGARLPSSRALASETGVSRVTVGVAFDQLRAEGYVEARTGSGTFVREGLPDDALQARRRRLESRQRARPAAAAALPTPRLPSALVQTHSLPVHQTSPIAFLAGVPALDLFPAVLWSKLSARRWRNAVSDGGARLLNYGNPMGYFPLRRAIASYVGLARGVRCEVEQVIVTAGAQQALDLAARVLVKPGESAWLEEPGYFGARAAFEAVGATIIPVPVDSEGLDVAAGEALDSTARLAYVSPSHQFPLGATLSMRRRLALLDWAARSRAWVIEDDYDGEFRYVGRPLASLQGLDADRSAVGEQSIVNGRVLYVGTFSKTLCPALRLGYLIVPPLLVETFAAAKGAAVGHTASVEQAVLTDFIEDGHYGRHVRRMRLVYADRQRALVAAASTHLAHWVDVRPSPAGMHLVGWVRSEIRRRGLTDRVLSEIALNSAVVTTPLSMYRLSQRGRELRPSAFGDGALLFGYAAFNEDAIWDGARRLERALAADPRSGLRRRRVSAG
jgi:GntR family transcriptional regulator/MocR family aminotransferase